MNDLTVANEIRNQIGQKALYMIGAKNLCGTQNSLSFKVMRNAKKVTHVRIELNSMDLYTVTFMACRAGSVKVINEIENAYNDSLKRLIETNTELYTNL